MKERLRAVLTAAIGVEVVRLTAVHGGDTAAAFRADLVGGGRLFAKTHASPPPGFFTTEALGLRWLREPGVIPVPQVLAVSDGDSDDAGAPGVAFLALEWIESGRPTSTTETRFGEQLAALHECAAPLFGRDDRRTTGSLALPNEPSASWSAFLAANRLLPLARIARDRTALPTTVIDRLERLARDLVRFDTGEGPSRLHGDLWAGNRIIDHTAMSWLIDPAAHGGHREFDLAMMRLFGGFSPECFRAYGDRFPLADGWAERVSLHQIAPLVVHAIKFGGGYVRSATETITRYV